MRRPVRRLVAALCKSQGHIGGLTQQCTDTADGQILYQIADVGLWWNSSDSVMQKVKIVDVVYAWKQ